MSADNHFLLKAPEILQFPRLMAIRSTPPRANSLGPKYPDAISMSLGMGDLARKRGLLSPSPAEVGHLFDEYNGGLPAVVGSLQFRVTSLVASNQRRTPNRAPDRRIKRQIARDHGVAPSWSGSVDRFMSNWGKPQSLPAATNLLRRPHQRQLLPYGPRR